MAEDTGQEKTEHPSPKRIQDAREKGNVPRSKELGVLALLVGAVLGFMFWGGMIVDDMKEVMKYSFSLDRAQISDPSKMLSALGLIVSKSFISTFLVLSFSFVLAILSTLVIGGWNFSKKAFMPKLDKLNPLSGIKKMFSANSAVELVKAIAKFLFVLMAAIWVIDAEKNSISALIKGDVISSIQQSLDIIMWAFLVMASTMLVIAAIDVPFQQYSYIKNLRMTMQEVKDEMKDVEGKPEVKSKIRQMQMQISQNRMISEVQHADVVIVNPEHYSVAVKYDADESDAPYVIAKGLDEVALKIREVAKEHSVPIVSAPPLARSIYKFTEINQKIPMGLYASVAQILAYVYQLRTYSANKEIYEKPKPVSERDIDIPENLRVD